MGPKSSGTDEALVVRSSPARPGRAVGHLLMSRVSHQPGDQPQVTLGHGQLRVWLRVPIPIRKCHHLLAGWPRRGERTMDKQDFGRRDQSGDLRRGGGWMPVSPRPGCGEAGGRAAGWSGSSSSRAGASPSPRGSTHRGVQCPDPPGLSASLSPALCPPAFVGAAGAQHPTGRLGTPQRWR